MINCYEIIRYALILIIGSLIWMICKDRIIEFFTAKIEKEETDNYRIIEEADGFRIQREIIYLKKHRFSWRRTYKVDWIYVKSHVDIQSKLSVKIRPFKTLEEAKKAFAKLTFETKYHYL